MGLQPLPEAAMVAANLRQTAANLILQAEALEATLPKRKSKKYVEFDFSKDKRMRRKQCTK